ncbi:MAG: hypothetical protein ABIK33_00265 [candidate division WOR-3 bacterium]
MVIDKIDLAIIRHLEKTGLWFNTLPEQLKLPLDSIRARIKKLESEQVILRYQPTIFIPPFLGGEWVWGCVLINGDEREKIIKTICQKIPFISEIWFCTNIPSNLGHNFSIIFYSKDFDSEVKFIKETVGVSYFSAYRIANYSYPLTRIFSSEEKQLLKIFWTNPLADVEQIAEVCQKNPMWVKSKLEKLIWSPQNLDGVIIVLPEIDYKRITNFAHCHFLLSANQLSGQELVSEDKSNLLKELKTYGFDVIFDGRLVLNKYLQIETDIWGFNDLIGKKIFLENYQGLKIHGIIIAEEMRVVSDWGKKLIEN